MRRLLRQDERCQRLTTVQPIGFMYGPSPMRKVSALNVIPVAFMYFGLLMERDFAPGHDGNPRAFA